MSDDNNGFELTRRRILAGVGTVGAASAATGAGTMALFSDTETSNNNTVQAGTLDLTPNSGSLATFSFTGLKPGEKTGVHTNTLTNSGSIDGDHVEFTASGLAQNDSNTDSPDGSGADKGASATARRFFVSTLSFDGSPIGWQPPKSNWLLLRDNGARALVFDGDMDGTADVRLSRTSKSGHSHAVHASSSGSTSDYAVSMRRGFSKPLGSIIEAGGGGTDVTYDYYAGASNENAAPDEVLVIVNDTSGNDHLVYRTKNDGTPSAQSWKTRDVGAEIIGSDTSRTWTEITSSGNVDLGVHDLSGEYSDSATLEAVGFGRGNFGNPVDVDVYYDNLKVGSNTYKFRPVSLFDLTKGKLDNLAGLNANSSKDFDVEFTFDPLAGNPFQGDGVDVDVEFGLAQNSGQDVL